jgi:hypothetical protein
MNNGGIASHSQQTAAPFQGEETKGGEKTMEMGKAL